MESIGGWITEIRDSAIVMAENIAYIRKELSEWDIPDETRAAIVRMCDRFGATLYDVSEEIVALHDELRSRLGGASVQSGVSDADPGARMDRVVACLRDELDVLHSVVTGLASVQKTDPSLGAVYVLVTESGGNILRAFVRVREARDAIVAGLDDGH
jgi:hypothetical protein